MSSFSALPKKRNDPQFRDSLPETSKTKFTAQGSDRAELIYLGVDFLSAPLELRERLALLPDETTRFLRLFRRRFPELEFLLLSTCNRTEVYAVGAVAQSPTPAGLRSFLLQQLGEEETTDTVAFFRDSRGADALEHLLRVAASLESMVLGETEILGQVKRAYLLAQEAETSGPRLRNLMPQVFRVAKKIRRQTDICCGRVSIGSIAIDLATRLLGPLTERKVLIIGAGKIGEQAMRTLAKNGAEEILLMNRSPENAHPLMRHYGCRMLPLDALRRGLDEADIVITSTSAPHLVIREEMVHHTLKQRQNRPPLLLIDLAMPRDVEDSIRSLPGVHLYNLDDLQVISTENLAQRKRAAGAAETIIRAERKKLASKFNF